MTNKKDLTDEQNLKTQEDSADKTYDSTSVEENMKASLEQQVNSEDNETHDKEKEASQVNEEERAQTKEKEDEDEELQIKYLRLAADFQNYKRRVEKEKNDIYAYANEKLMVELLDVIDNFDRALALETADTGMKKGMEMILRQFIDVLEKCGLSEIEADGKEFDPIYHNAVQTECSDDHNSGQITKVLQKGYMLNNKVIRASTVIVAQ